MEKRFCFLLDIQSGEEITRLESWAGDYWRTEEEHKRPIGTLFNRYMDLDINILETILGHYKHTLDIKNKSSWKAAVEHLKWIRDETIVPELPDFCTGLTEQVEEMYSILTGYETFYAADKMRYKAAVKKTISAFESAIRHRSDLEELLFSRAGKRDIPSGLSPSEKYTALMHQFGNDRIHELFMGEVMTIVDVVNSHDGLLPAIYYRVDADLSVIPKAYFQMLLYSGATFQICGHCNRPFVTSGGFSTLYCQRIADSLGNTCKQLGASRKRDKLVASDPVRLAYRQAYNRQANRYRRGQLSKEAYNEWRERAKLLHDLTMKGGDLNLEDYFEWMNQ